MGNVKFNLKVVVEVGGKEIVLTPEEADVLRRELNDIFTEKIEVPMFPPPNTSPFVPNIDPPPDLPFTTLTRGSFVSDGFGENEVNF